MMDRMYDLSWEIAGDTIQLEQDAGCGEVSRVDLHTCQLRLLAERAGLLGVDAQTDSERRDSERRQEGLIRVLLRKLIELQGVIHEQRDYEPETWLRLPLILELAGFLFEDITHECPFEDPEDGPRNENSQAVSVTPEVTKCGRPATGEAMTNAERQAKHRAKQKESVQQRGKLIAEAAG